MLSLFLYGILVAIMAWSLGLYINMWQWWVFILSMNLLINSLKSETDTKKI